MKRLGFITMGIILVQTMIQAQCDVNYQETLDNYCSGIYLIHQELNNQNSGEATLILHEGNSYNIYLLNPTQRLSDLILLSNGIDITSEFDLIEEGKAALYQITSNNTNEYRFSLLTQAENEVCVLLAIYLQPFLNKDIPAGLYRNLMELKFRNPGHPYIHNFAKKRVGSLTKRDYHYKLNLGRKEKQQIGEVYAFNDGKDTYFNIARLSKSIIPGLLFAKAEDLEEFFYVEYYEAGIVPTYSGTIYTDSWQKKLINKETGEIMKLNKKNLKEIIKDDPQLLQEYVLESNKTKKLKNYLIRYLERAHEEH